MEAFCKLLTRKLEIIISLAEGTIKKNNFFCFTSFLFVPFSLVSYRTKLTSSMAWSIGRHRQSGVCSRCHQI